MARIRSESAKTADHDQEYRESKKPRSGVQRFKPLSGGVQGQNKIRSTQSDHDREYREGDTKIRSQTTTRRTEIQTTIRSTERVRPRSEGESHSIFNNTIRSTERQRHTK